ncbi:MULTISPECIES: hypothetical protein [Agrobacterium]|uniref:hypothetical protein n=1 Tax=Agrobacterium TaxID=357 RepID=UPI0009BBACD6|nr:MULTISPECIES: hypothetical protein [Agrobacterium]QCL76069.1 hypothetical protein CFBP5499_21745 [Agrobacterium tumefaciens]CUX69258.1 conserved hypothetical protein [Agrobacterium sp. NCPPB 925]
MSYDYVRNYYGVEVTVNQFVRHTVTGRIGTIMPENASAGHYVQVLFRGDKHTMSCHPQELEAADDL